MYGDGITRDLEPTVQDKGSMWALFESCMRVFRSGAATCADKAEACCARGQDHPLSDWVQVASLTTHSAGGGEGEDYLLTTDMHERHVLLSQGGWVEVCSADGSATAFCKWSTSVAPNASAYRTGPFTMWAGSISAELSRPCHRCITSAAVTRATTVKAGRHFISSDEQCLGLGAVESVLGYVSTQRSSDTPRSLRLCHGPAGRLRHSLDSVCGLEEEQLEFLGFVH